MNGAGAPGDLLSEPAWRPRAGTDSHRPREVVVVGAGVIGLTTAVVLAGRGHRVRIWAREATAATTSAAAGAMWLPFLAAPAHLVTRWSGESLAVYRRLVTSAPASGCFDVHAELFFDHRPAEHPWSTLVDGYRSGPAAGPRAAQYRYRQSADVPMIDVSRYLPFLSSQLRRRGVQVEQRRIDSLDDLLGETPIVVNCTGLGSVRLAADPTLRAVRGQTVRVRSRDWPHAHRRPTAVLDEEGHNSLAFVFPRIDDIVLGGTVQHDDWRLEPDPDDTAAILARCRALAPELGDLEILGTTVGLRPARPEVRVECVDRGGGRLLIHNYGHGGSGYTLSWGCALDVADLIDLNA